MSRRDDCISIPHRSPTPAAHGTRTLRKPRPCTSFPALTADRDQGRGLQARLRTRRAGRNVHARITALSATIFPIAPYDTTPKPAEPEPNRLPCYDAPALSISDRCNCATVRNRETYTKPDSSPELSTVHS